MHEHVVAAAHAAQLEAEPLHHTTRVAKRHIGELSARESNQELAVVHPWTVALAWDGIRRRAANQSELVSGPVAVMMFAVPATANFPRQRRLQQEGWTLERGGKHQVKMTKPSHRPITLPENKRRAYSKGFEAQLRREAGL